MARHSISCERVDAVRLRAPPSVTGDNGAMADIEHLPESKRFEIRIDGRAVGLLDYDVRGDSFVATHTEIDPPYGGRGLGGELVTRVLDYVRSTGQRLVPRCSFVAHYVDTHPEYGDLVGVKAGADSGADSDARYGSGSGGSS